MPWPGLAVLLGRNCERADVADRRLRLAACWLLAIGRSGRSELDVERRKYSASSITATYASQSNLFRKFEILHPALALVPSRLGRNLPPLFRFQLPTASLLFLPQTNKCTWLTPCGYIRISSQGFTFYRPRLPIYSTHSSLLEAEASATTGQSPQSAVRPVRRTFNSVE